MVDLKSLEAVKRHLKSEFRVSQQRLAFMIGKIVVRTFEYDTRMVRVTMIFS